MRVGVGEDIALAHRLDDADLAARIARQPGVAGRVDVLRAHAVAGRESRRRATGRLHGPPAPSPRATSAAFSTRVGAAPVDERGPRQIRPGHEAVVHEQRSSPWSRSRNSSS